MLTKSIDYSESQSKNQNDIEFRKATKVEINNFCSNLEAISTTQPKV